MEHILVCPQRKSTRKSTRLNGDSSALKENLRSSGRTSTIKKRLQELVEKSTSPLASPGMTESAEVLVIVSAYISSCWASESMGCEKNTGFIIVHVVLQLRGVEKIEGGHEKGNCDKVAMNSKLLCSTMGI